MHMECHCCSGGHDHHVVIGSGDLCQLMHRINAQPPLPTSFLLAAMQNKNGSSGDSDAMGTRDSWSNGILDIVTMLGEGASGMVEAVWDKWMGCWFTSKTIIMYKGLLKQLVHKLVFLSGLRHIRHMNLPSFRDNKKHGSANSCCEILHLADRLPSGHPSPNTSWGGSTPSVWMYGCQGLRMRMAWRHVIS
ncbi:hypothetical protein F5148DRAFT_1154084 [Russula earlei]|uniref:Uncharacterized protein n=1 Tax=Russula earlei TaxID=71964 RepID=A0ACC0TS63_9AGAM|nr:hypothetical protein F5148DRAFT_1154084 [Russula earlei]